MQYMAHAVYIIQCTLYNVRCTLNSIYTVKKTFSFRELNPLIDVRFNKPLVENFFKLKCLGRLFTKGFGRNIPNTLVTHFVY